MTFLAVLAKDVIDEFPAPRLEDFPGSLPAVENLIEVVYFVFEGCFDLYLLLIDAFDEFWSLQLENIRFELYKNFQLFLMMHSMRLHGGAPLFVLHLLGTVMPSR